ncbi:uncharacterized protein LOC116307463 [Actinia tenebrosa]|uniref:Uncharacterized protein LOC116307463 n=1 Tax=Actinia tenebrosa TaxID=6105 RepID=A0A6P8J9S9_ACTTE|nr:uncharacterized protein LOC116307463 [Actinia tenebrosa]
MAESSKTIQLLIISKSKYGSQRWCYLGLDRSGKGRIYRPIPSQGLEQPNEEDFFWLSQYDFQVGETHEFGVVHQDPKSNHDNDPLPHRNDDIQVNHKSLVAEAGMVNMTDMFQILSPYAKETIEEALGCQEMMLASDRGRQYVEEGTNCSSCGIYKSTREAALQHPPVPVLVIILPKPTAESKSGQDT